MNYLSDVDLLISYFYFVCGKISKFSNYMLLFMNSFFFKLDSIS